jgi:1-acyl-sn-glycerol-3-phosphate acyltransferase
VSERQGIDDHERRNGSDAAHGGEESEAACQATTRSGQPCRNRALPGSSYCRVHQPDLAATHADADEDAAARAPFQRVEIDADDSWLEDDSGGAEQASAAPDIQVRGRIAPAAIEAGAVDIVLHNLEQQVRAQPGDPTRELALGVLKLARENLERLGGESGKRVAELLAGINVDDLRSPEFWQGLGMVVRYQLDEQIARLRRRQRGSYPTDPYGFDPEVLRVVRPFANFLYRSWWRVETLGIERIPERGRALLVANHSGVLPFDGVMIVTSIYEEHPRQRLVRSLFNHWFATVPFLAPLLTGLGQVQALPENARRLLEEDELVCTFPEGYKGAGKLFGQRYQLSRFGRGGYVQAALQTGAPLIPVAVIGAEETYPMLIDFQPLARLIGAPYFPITPFFPWLGALGAIPLPTKWWIEFGEPIPTASYGPQGADDPLLVARLSEQVREAIQRMIDDRLARRGSIFLG